MLGQRLLLMSCFFHDNAGVECIGVLLSAGADRDLQDVDGKTAAHAAAEAGRDDCARALTVDTGSTKVGSSTFHCDWSVITLALSKNMHYSILVKFHSISLQKVNVVRRNQRYGHRTVYHVFGWYYS